MLKTIHIKDFALAQNLHINFNDRLNIITGETGTGKSILVGAISAVLGGRVFTEVIRTGSDKATVEAIFDISILNNLKEKLKEKGLNDTDELILRREISYKPNARAFVNDTPVTIKTLSEIGDLLVDIHGQSEHQSLLRKETHRYFLDSYGRMDSLLQKVSEQYNEVGHLTEKLQNLQNRQKNLEEKYTLYQFQLEEIDRAQLKEGEDEELEAERKILTNTEKIFTLSSEFVHLIDDGEKSNLRESMGQALHILKELSEFSKDFRNIVDELSSAKIILEESGRVVEEFKNKLEYDPTRLEEIESRLATISLLKKKYAPSVDSILEYRDKVKSELLLKENFDIEIDTMYKQLQESLDKYKNLALELSDARKKVAKKLENDVVSLLKKIGMSKIRFQVLINYQESEDGIIQKDQKRYYGDQYGIDQIEFYISTNPGEDFKALNRIASGGEISRIMLALKNILAEQDQIPLLIFDEIDLGISGQIASAVGKSIQELAKTHQIICITHLPQIASFGNSHYRVDKIIKDGRTFTQVQSLFGEERVEEVANLIGGKKLSNEIIQSARQLLREAEEDM